MEEPKLGTLVFPSKFYGREFELAQLQDVYSRLSGTEMITVAGFSGTGKSSLMKRFSEQVDGFFLSGKADELINSPYTSLIDAFGSFCEAFVKGTDEIELKRIKTSILEAIGSEGKVLTDLIPCLEKLIGVQAENSDVASNSRSLRRLQYVFGRFMCAICTKERPVVLFLDDCQWADQPTLDLLCSLVLDRRLKHLMIVISYRDNEVDAEHALSATLDQIRKRGRAYLTLNLGNLSLEDIKQLVRDTLFFEDEETDQLASALFEKTSGNIYYTRTSISELERERILSYSYVEMKWLCNLTRVKEVMRISDNVVSMVVSRLERLDPNVQLVLTTAAFLGSTFNTHLLGQLLEACNNGMAFKGLAECLDVAVSEGFLSNLMGSPLYRFTHDRIMEAATSLLPNENRDKLSLAIGQQLAKFVGSDENLIFVAVDRLNSVPIRFLTERMTVVGLAELNLKAGKRAVRLSAFAPAAKYLRTGVELIEKDEMRWEEHYSLCLRIYNSAADVEFCFGSFAEAKRYADEVIHYARTFEDKIPAMTALSEGLGQRQQHFDALEIDIAVLEHYGEMPKHCNVANIMWQIKKIKKRLQGLTDSDILSMPMMTDPIKRAIMKFRSRVALRAWYCRKVQLFEACVLRGLRMTLDNGLSVVGAYNFSGLATVLFRKYGEEKLGIRLTRLAMEAMRLTNAKKYEAKILFTSSNYISPWSKPIAKVMEDCNTCYKSGMESGDVEFGFFGFGLYSVLSYVSGLPLESILVDLELYLGILQQYQVDTVYATLSALKDLILGLTGHGMNAAQLSKAAEHIPRDGSLDPSKTIALADKCTAYMQLAYFLGDFLLADEMFKEAKIYGATNPSFYYITSLNVFSLLIATACYRETKRKKYRSRAKEALETMKKLMKSKGINITHKYLLMKAEYSATFQHRKGRSTIKEEFDRAISAATRGGVMHEAALANELAGEYSIVAGDRFWARHYLTPAYAQFLSWGANAKVKRLLETHGDLINKDERSSAMGTTRKGRALLANDALKMHSTIDTQRSTEDCVTLASQPHSFCFEPSEAFLLIADSKSFSGDNLPSGNGKSVAGSGNLSDRLDSGPLEVPRT